MQVMEELARAGLKTLDDVRAFKGSIIKVFLDRRDVLTFDLPGPDGRPRRMYMKRIFKTPLKDSLRSLARHGRVISTARLEFEALQALQANRIPACRPVAMGEDCSLFRERFSFLVTEEIPTQQTLLDYLGASRDPRQRRRVIRAAGQLVGRLHAAGLTWPDLYARHIFVTVEGEEIRLWLIDVARLRRPILLTPMHRARDLCNLAISAPLRVCSWRERFLFLRAYDRRPSALLLAAMRLRLARISKSKRARKFGYLSE